MCDHLSEVGHAKAEADLRIAKDVTRPFDERSPACQAAKRAGLCTMPQPRSVEPTPFCSRLNEVRERARKLWDEDLSPQAQRERYRQAQAVTLEEPETGELRGAEATEYIAAHLRWVSGDANTLVTNYVDRSTDEPWLMDRPFGDRHHLGPPRLRRRSQSA